MTPKEKLEIISQLTKASEVWSEAATWPDSDWSELSRYHSQNYPGSMSFLEFFQESESDYREALEDYMNVNEEVLSEQQARQEYTFLQYYLEIEESENWCQENVYRNGRDQD